jgi:hypothetical protein
MVVNWPWDQLTSQIFTEYILAIGSNGKIIINNYLGYQFILWMKTLSMCVNISIKVKVSTILDLSVQSVLVEG